MNKERDRKGALVFYYRKWLFDFLVFSSIIFPVIVPGRVFSLTQLFFLRKGVAT
jgi:hypothetical protein